MSYRKLGLGALAVCGLITAPAFADSVNVTLSGNFGSGGLSVLDNQNYTITFSIADPASPSRTYCCAGTIIIVYDDTNAQLSVPGIGLSLNEAVGIVYNTSPGNPGNWMNVIGFTGLPQGDLLLWSGVQLDNGNLWNGLADPLGTPVINLFNDAPGTGLWALEQYNPTTGDIPIDSGLGAIDITVTSVPEPAGGWLLGTAILALGLFHKRWTGRLLRIARTEPSGGRREML
jgi:hypothetical protein